MPVTDALTKLLLYAVFQLVLVVGSRDMVGLVVPDTKIGNVAFTSVTALAAAK